MKEFLPPNSSLICSILSLRSAVRNPIEDKIVKLIVGLNYVGNKKMNKICYYLSKKQETEESEPINGTKILLASLISAM